MRASIRSTAGTPDSRATMHEFLAWLRRLGGNDAKAAWTRERSRVEAAAKPPAVDQRFLAEMRRLAAQPAGSALVGRSVAVPDLEVRIPFEELTGQGHGIYLGGTGVGKTYLVGHVVMQLIRRSLSRARPSGVWVIDHKSEFVALMRKFLAALVAELPAPDARRLLDAIVVIDPFSSEALVPLQVLCREPGVAAEVQAWEVTTLIDRMGGADLGTKQDDLVYHVALLGILRGLTLVDLAGMLGDPTALAAAADGCESPEVRTYFRAGPRLSAASLDGVRARLNRLLRLPSSRLMLGASRSTSFRTLLADRIVLVDVGSPPLGCEDLGRFWSGLVTLKLTRAIFERSEADAKRSVSVFIDEWQEGLAAGGDVAEQYERILAMARSRNISLHLISQSLAGAARVSSVLPKVVATNTNIQVLFRSSIEDAQALAHVVPVSGRVRRERPAPWETEQRSPYLTRNEEFQARVAEVASLPNRTFYLWNRRRPYRAELVEATELDLTEPTLPAPVAARLRRGVLGVPVAELAAQGALADTTFWPLSPTTPAAAEDAAPPRRPRPRRR